MAVLPSLQNLQAAPRLKSVSRGEPREVFLGRIPRAESTAAKRAVPAALDPVVQAGPAPRDMPGPLITFEGPGNLDGVLPPDNNGDVGPQHYVAMVNMHFCIYDKATGAALIAPMLMSELFAAAGFPAPASTTDDGDPVVLYDHLADRWFLSQFIVSVTPCHEVIAISQTGDPTGAWYLYDFVMPNDKMNDYPHFGVWPDGYYMTDNQFDTAGGAGAGVFAFDRAKMLVGDPSATYQYFDLETVDANYGGMLPADLDGPLPPEGTPNYFAMVDDDAWGVSPVDALYVWEFHVDWDVPANTTFGRGLRPNFTNAVAPFDSAFAGGRNNVPQKDTTQKLDAIADRLMHRVQYRNFGDHESLTACHTVDADGTDHAGVRYYELRRALPGGTEFVVQEQATFAPDGDHRWMGSAAMDMYGNLAVGYSVSGTNTFPSIRYAGRMVTDPPGGLFQGEAELWAGAGSQTHTAARWGDYSMLAVDPADGVTFWYINEYLPATSSAGWQTRIGSFRLGSPEVGTIVGTVTNTLLGTGISGARVFTTNGYAATAGAGGGFVLNLPTGTHFVAAAADGYYTGAVVEVEMLLNETNFIDFGLAPIPLRITPRTGLSASGMAGGPFSPSSQTYVFSNASLAELAWTSQWTAAWLDVSPQEGVLDAGEAVSVVISCNSEATFLTPGAYADTVAFSNVTEGRVETRSVALAVTPYYEPITCEGFDAGLPAGWNVIDHTANAAPWRFDDPGGHGNLTGGEGIFAVVDSDYVGQLDMDTELQSPAMDFTDYPVVACRFKTDFYSYDGTEVADVDVSVNGAAGPWSNLWRQTASLRGPRTVELDLSAAAAGESNVVLRFHYYDANYEWWWQVDDVCFVGARDPDASRLAIQPPAGLEASGYYSGPFVPERLYRLSNSSVDETLEWSAAASAPWFETVPGSGTLGAGEETIVTVRMSAAASALLPGDYSGEVAFQNETEGVEAARSVSLTVEEPLVVQPNAGIVARGLEGGPFTSDDQTYALANPSAQGFAWTSLWSAAWLDVAPNHGDLAAQTTQTVTVALADDWLTTPGVYSDVVVFSNLVTHGAFARTVTVTVVEITGELEVSDSVDPADDLLIPFGTVEPVSPRTEHVTVMNTDAPGGRNLIVSNIFFGYYAEDFAGGSLSGWDPDVEAHWTAVGGEYRAQTADEQFMTSVLAGGQAWADASAQVDVRRSGYTGSSAGLAFRTTTDLDLDGTGQGYLFLISSNFYSVWWQNETSFTALQGWTLSTTIKGGATDTNQLLVSAVGSEFRFYVNGTLTWEGSHAGGSAGTIALAAYNMETLPTTTYFDNVRVGAPRTEIVGLGRKTRYYNARPLAESRPQGLPRGKTLPDVDKALAALDEAEPRADDEGPFALSSLPAFPATLAPGESFTFDVTYSPVAVGSNADVVTIWNNDNDEPWAHVDVNGRAAAGSLTGRVTAAHSGAPLVGATVVADNGVIQLDTATDTNGLYRLDLLVGEWTVSATAPNYATGTVAGVAIADLLDTAQDFVLTGSLLTAGPASIEETLNWGQGATNALCLTNSGPFDLDVQLRSYLRASGSAPVAIPPSAGDFPRGAAAPSAAGAPAQTPTGSSEPTMQAPARVLCYGIDMDNQQLVSFYSDAPGTFTVIGSSGANLIPCADFLNGDFATLYALDYAAQQLVTFDVVTAAKTVVGAAAPASGHSWVGLAADPDGTLYAASTDGSTSMLYQIDPATGTAATVGAIANAPLIIAIAINGAGDLYGLDIANDNLLQIDKATGAGTVVGSVGFDANYAQGMDFDEESDVLYLAAYNNATSAGELRIADVLTGNSALVGAFQGNAEMNIAVASGGAVPWVSIAPETVNIPAGGSACVDVGFDTYAVPNAATTHLARIAFSGNFVNEAAPVNLSLTVIPNDLDVAPADVQTASGELGGPFDPAQFLYVATNQGVASLDWTLTHAAAWLDVGPTNGALAAGSSAVVTAAFNAVAATLAVGSYTDVVTFVNQADGVHMSRTIVLEVSDSCAVLISEYVEGSSNNKALEIYNPHAAAIDLAAGQYVVQGYQNGGVSATYTISLTGTVAAEDAYVLAHSSAGAAILAVADQTSGSLTFNGNDAVVLRSGGASGPVLDSIGQVGVDPGTEWGSGLTSTMDNTLRRKTSVKFGDAVTTNAFDPATEWDGYAVDTFGGLGSHTNDCTSPPLPTPPILNPVGNQFVLLGDTLQFPVVATPTDGDAVTLTTSSLPAGATFGATNENGSFVWETAAPTGVYSVTFTATDKDGADEETISVTVGEELPAPVIQAATGVQATQFDANWLPAAGATGYRLDVATNATFASGSISTTNLSENFAGFTAVSGTLDRAATLDTYLQTPGWTGIKIFENAGTAKIGTTSVKGYITTPTVDLSANGGAATLKFDLWKYGSDVGLVQVMHAPDGSVFAQVGADLTPPAALSNYTMAITGGTAFSKIQITAKAANNNRFNLDNVQIVQPATVSQYMPGYENRDVGGATTCAVTGLTEITTYYYRAKAYTATTNSPYSETTNVTTVARVPPVLNPIGDQAVAEGDVLQFDVVAAPTDGDAVTLTASNLPAGATFSATNENGSFVWENASPTGVYAVTFYATDNDGADEETISIEVAEAIPELLAPVVQAATAVQATQFNANWLAADTATGYRLDVATRADFQDGSQPGEALLAEDFQAWDGSTWINGWTHGGAMQYAMGGWTNSRCVGLNSTDDWIQAPPCTNPATLSFYVRTSSDPGSWMVLVQTSPDGNDWTDQATLVENETGGILNNVPYQTNVALNLTGVYRVRWYMAVQAEDSCYLDNVLIAAAPPASSFVPGFEYLDVGGATTCVVTGLTEGTTYYYRAKAYNAATNSPYSETTNVTTLLPGTPPALSPIGDQSIFLGETLQFEVSATPTESDAVTLTASNLPAGAAFYPTNELGTFLWTGASPTGLYSVTFNAADEDGFDEETIGIAVHPLPQFGTFTASNGAPASASFLSVPGQEYRLEYTLDLEADPVVWALAASTNGTGEILTLSDTNAPDLKRYYRIAAP